MKTRIVSDSSCDILTLKDVDFISVPLTISSDSKSFLDDKDLNVKEMLDYFASHKGRSYTSCPSIDAWINSFEGADVIFVITMTSTLSGTYNSAVTARHIYLEKHPDTEIYIIDTMSTGPEMHLLIDKISSLIKDGMAPNEIYAAATNHLKSTRLFFSFESLHNLSQNGRISKLAASAAGVLGIRVFGTATADGRIEPLSKCRGQKKTILAFIKQLEEIGYAGKKIYISHIENESLASDIKNAILSKYQNADISIYGGRGLCSYYAERGGVIVGCEI